ncbi:RNA polymerase sigma factor [Chitinophaga rhizosphaerae]|uniref:RNA polymerase sigma factor n=1 Tax=Chitinophaga rhizosphaerae TaxID=1864947 RepID=UPI000F80A567|nr:RNA polymerase sigma-70 factor [Chitinophaga rhizosphaerae]
MNTSTTHEHELLIRLSEGDGAAFAELFHEYRDRIYATAVRLMGSHSHAEEIVQEVFMKIWLNRSSLPQVTFFRAYLFTTARNQIFNSLKQLARERTADILHAEPACKGTEERVLGRDFERVLQNAVRQLPPQQERVYHLSKVEGRPRHEVAHLLQLSPETVKVHLARAMRSIREYCTARMDIPGLMLSSAFASELFFMVV